MDAATAVPRRRAWIALLIAAALAVFLLVRWAVPGGPAAPAKASVAASTGADPSSSGEPTAAPSTAPAGKADSNGSPPPPIIDRIEIEKPEVCEGEENLVTVVAHDPGGNDAGLRSLVNGQPGWAVPLRVRENDEDPGAPRPAVVVVGDNGAVVSVPIPPYKIMECPAAARLRMMSSLLPNTTAEFRLEAKLIKGVPPGRPRPDRFLMGDFQPTRYQWDFGDGERLTTPEAYVTHSYEFREQRTYYSYYLLTVTASDEQGRTLVARHALEIMNPAYEELAQKDVVKIMTHNAPRFPELVDGKVTQQIRLWHFERHGVTVDKVIAYAHDAFGKELARIQMPPEAVLGTRTVPPGAGITIPMVLDVGARPEVGFVTYDLHGTSGGRRVMGSFSIMRPPEPPTPEKNTPVTDGMMAARIKRAMELLGKQYVTDEDIWELERQGKLEGLTPLSVPPPVPGPPPGLPRPPRSDGEPWSPDDDPGPYSPDDPSSSAPR
jgi:hypothetical protein